MFFSKSENKSKFTYKTNNLKKQKPNSIFDDFELLMNNMNSLQDLDLDKLSADDHIQAIKFYSYVKFKRLLLENVKAEIKSQMNLFKEEMREEIKSIKEFINMKSHPIFE